MTEDVTEDFTYFNGDKMSAEDIELKTWMEARVRQNNDQISTYSPEQHIKILCDLLNDSSECRREAEESGFELDVDEYDVGELPSARFYSITPTTLSRGGLWAWDLAGNALVDGANDGFAVEEIDEMFDEEELQDRFGSMANLKAIIATEADKWRAEQVRAKAA